MSNTSKFLAFCLTVACLVLSGCGGEPRPEGLPKLYPITLHFVQEGEPLDMASVFLISQEGSKWSSGGVTDAKGAASFRTHGKFVGVPAGKYKVMVQKSEIVPKGGRGPQSEAPSSMDTYDLVSPDYCKPDKTPLEIEVRAGKNNFAPFDLGKKVRIFVPPINY